MVQKQIVSSEKTNKDNGIHQEELNYPKIRFPEFDKYWEEVQLRDIATFSKGKGISKNEISEKGIPCIRYGELYTKYDENITEIYSKTNLEIENLVLSEKNDILIPCSGETAIDLATASCVRDENVAIGGDITIIKTNQYAPFITYCLNNKRTEIAKYAQGVSIVHLYAKNFQNMKIKIPQISEQKKIVDLLENLNKKIDSLEEKYEIKKLIKNYYLNKILFDDFQNNRQWDLKPLNEITFYQEGPGVRNYQYVSEGIKLLNVGNFVENKLILENTNRYISEEEAYGIYKHFLVDEGDLLIACSGIRAEYFDEKIAFAEKEHLPLCMNTSTMRFKSLDEKYINLNYLKWYFQTTLFKKQIFRVLTGSAQFNFGPTHLKYLKIIVPPLDYQIKISKFFDLIKKDLDNTKMQIGEMEKFKKALLQKMFV